MKKILLLFVITISFVLLSSCKNNEEFDQKLDFENALRNTFLDYNSIDYQYKLDVSYNNNVNSQINNIRIARNNNAIIEQKIEGIDINKNETIYFYNNKVYSTTANFINTSLEDKLTQLNVQNHSLILTNILALKKDITSTNKDNYYTYTLSISSAVFNDYIIGLGQIPYTSGYINIKLEKYKNNAYFSKLTYYISASDSEITFKATYTYTINSYNNILSLSIPIDIINIMS